MKSSGRKISTTHKQLSADDFHRWISVLAVGFAILFVAAGLVSCSDQNAARQEPVPINKGDTCAVCGMYIEKYPGPRAEAYVQGRAEPLKFGSTRDFFAYILQPENQTQLQSLFVQDTAKIDWQHPSGTRESFINARRAYYAVFQNLTGAMGPTLAPFAGKVAAERFIATHGGALLRFDQITPALISGLTSACPTTGSPLAKLVKDCVKGTVPSRIPAPGP